MPCDLLLGQSYMLVTNMEIDFVGNLVQAIQTNSKRMMMTNLLVALLLVYSDHISKSDNILSSSKNCVKVRESFGELCKW